MIRYYTYAEKQYIRNSWGRIPIKYIAKKLDRTPKAIKRKLLDLGIKERPISVQNTTKWTKEEIDIVKNLYERGYPTIIIAEYLSRSQLSIDNLFDNMKKREKRNQLNNTKSVYEYLKVEYEQKKAG